MQLMKSFIPNMVVADVAIMEITRKVNAAKAAVVVIAEEDATESTK